MKRLLAADWSSKKDFLSQHALRRQFAGSGDHSPRARSRLRVLRSAGQAARSPSSPAGLPGASGPRFRSGPRHRRPSAGDAPAEASPSPRPPLRDSSQPAPPSLGSSRPPPPLTPCRVILVTGTAAGIEDLVHLDLEGVEQDPSLERSLEILGRS